MIALALPGNLVAISLTSIGREYGLTNEELGRLAAVSGTTWVISLVLGGPLADRIGPRMFFNIGFVLVTCGMATYGTGNSYAHAIVGSALYGIGGGMLDLIASPVVAALQPTKQAEALNKLHACFSLGSIIALAVGLSTLSYGLPWRVAFLGFTLVPMGYFVLTMRAELPTKLSTEDKAHGHSRLMMRTLGFWAFAGMIYCAGASEMGLAVWLPAHVEQTFKTTTVGGGLALLGFFATMTVGRMIGGRVLERFSPTQVLVTSAAFTGPLIAAAAWSTHGTASIVTAMLVGLATSALWPTTLALAAQRFPQGGATMFGWLAGFGASSGITAPWLIGAIADRSNIRNGVGATSVAPIVLLLILGAVSLRRSRRQVRYQQIP